MASTPDLILNVDSAGGLITGQAGSGDAGGKVAITGGVGGSNFVGGVTSLTGGAGTGTGDGAA